ncbi:ComF family protein [Amycolatopsis sp.]|uniref:ComF family protein n=1 Tax=Amycolatopsis sp. TaxID=37632 RepID=UPI0034574DBD
MTCRAVWGSLREVARAPTDGVVPVYALAAYRGVARRLVLAYKERGRRDLAASLGGALAEAVPVLPGVLSVSSAEDSTTWLVPVPSRRVAARVRGGPHMRRLARHCARSLAETGRPAAVAPALRLDAGVRDAVGLDRRQRVSNLAGRVSLQPAGAPPAGAAVVLLDDVVTTGATAAVCARALTDAGMVVTAVLSLTAAG